MKTDPKLTMRELFVEAKVLFWKLADEVDLIDKNNPTYEQVDSARRASAQLTTKLALLQMEIEEWGK